MRLNTFGSATAAILSVAAGALLASPEYQYLAIYVFVLSLIIWFALLGYFVISNFREILSGAQKLGSWSFIVPCFAIAALGIAGAAYGLGLRSNAGYLVGKVAQPPVEAAPLIGEQRSVLASARFYSKADRERIADALTSIQGAYSEPGLAAIRETREGSDNAGQATAEQLDHFISIMNGVKGRVEGIDAAIERVRRENTDYVSEIGLLLNSQHLLRQFGMAAGNFSNMLLVWKNMGPTAGENSNQLSRVLMSQRESLYRSMNDFQQWMQNCDQAIQATRMALRS